MHKCFDSLHVGIFVAEKIISIHSTSRTRTVQKGTSYQNRHLFGCTETLQIYLLVLILVLFGLKASSSFFG